MKYKVTVTNSYAFTVEVEAEDEAEAICEAELANDNSNQEEYVDTTFKAVEACANDKLTELQIEMDKVSKSASFQEKWSAAIRQQELDSAKEAKAQRMTQESLNKSYDI